MFSQRFLIFGLILCFVGESYCVWFHPRHDFSLDARSDFPIPTHAPPTKATWRHSHLSDFDSMKLGMVVDPLYGVYVPTSNGITKYDGRTGAHIWHTFNDIRNQWCRLALNMDGSVLYAAARETGMIASVWALDPMTGDVLWSDELEHPSTGVFGISGWVLSSYGANLHHDAGFEMHTRDSFWTSDLPGAITSFSVVGSAAIFSVGYALNGTVTYYLNDLNKGEVYRSVQLEGISIVDGIVLTHDNYIIILGDVLMKIDVNGHIQWTYSDYTRVGPDADKPLADYICLSSKGETAFRGEVNGHISTTVVNADGKYLHNLPEHGGMVFDSQDILVVVTEDRQIWAVHENRSIVWTTSLEMITHESYVNTTLVEVILDACLYVLWHTGTSSIINGGLVAIDIGEIPPIGPSSSSQPHHHHGSNGDDSFPVIVILLIILCVFVILCNFTCPWCIGCVASITMVILTALRLGSGRKTVQIQKYTAYRDYETPVEPQN